MIAGKLAADLVFYALAIPAYELRERGGHERPALTGLDAAGPAALDALPYATPYLALDLDAVERAYVGLRSRAAARSPCTTP